MTGISKGKGLALLCQYLNISIDHTLACGDSENDLDIMKAAGLGVAMANAPRAIQELADDITLSNDEHGVAAMIQKWLYQLFANGQVATQYVNEQGQPTMDETWNINGSYMAIEGITSPDGRVLGKMAHSERRGESVAINIYGEQDMKLFESGVA